MRGFIKASRVACVHAPAALGQPKDGAGRAPFQLLAAGLAERCAASGATVSHQMIPPVATLGRLCHDVAGAVFEEAAAGSLVIVSGGDHAVAMGSIPGMVRALPQLRVLWIDAHADFNSPLTSPSGNPHGMPLAGVTGEFSPAREWPADFSWLQNLVATHRVALVGIRAVDDDEGKALKRSGMWTRDARECLAAGPESLASTVYDALDLGPTTPLHVSFDVDSLDPSVAPATGTPVEGGLGRGFVPKLIAALAARGVPIVGLDIVELNADCAAEGGVASSLAECLAVVDAVMDANVERAAQLERAG